MMPISLCLQPSVDGTSPVAAKVYEDLWKLQSILQNPWGCMVNNDSYKGATDLIEEALRVMAATPIKVVSRSTAVPPKGGPAWVYCTQRLHAALAHSSCCLYCFGSLLWSQKTCGPTCNAIHHCDCGCSRVLAPLSHSGAHIGMGCSFVAVQHWPLLIGVPPESL